MRDLFSIIIPAYNAESTIERCVKSVLLQKYSEMEIIIVNDGSEDRTAEIVTCLADKYQNLRLITTENHGVSLARNIGIAESKGKWISFVDADDELEPDFISTAIDDIQKMGADTICYNSSYVDGDGYISRMNSIYPQKIYKNEEILKLIKSLYIDVDGLYSGDFFRACWGKVLSAQIIKDNFLSFPADIPIGEDAVFLIDYFNASQNVLLYNKYEYKYYRTSESVIGRFKSELLELQKKEFAAMIKSLEKIKADTVQFKVAFWHRREKEFIENELKASYSHYARIIKIAHFLSDATVRKYLACYDERGIKSKIRSLLEKNGAFYFLAFVDYWIIYMKHK